jgi:flagellar protein FliS
VRTADQLELVLILYKGAITQLNLAASHIRNRDIPNRVSCINKAVAMIGELQAALDFDRGGEIAASLNRLYSYILSRLTLANLRSDVVPIEETIELLSTLQSAWAEVRAQQVSSTQVSPSGEGNRLQAVAG